MLELAAEIERADSWLLFVAANRLSCDAKHIHIAPAKTRLDVCHQALVNAAAAFAALAY